MTVINTNVSALYAQAAITSNARSLSTAMQELSTGKRINSASDDAAGIAIASKLTSQIKGLNQAVRNANDGISMLQTAEGATNEITNMLQRMRELTVQSGNDTNSTTDRTALATEYDQLANEIDRVAGTTKWNGMNVLNATTNSGTFSFQVGSDGGSADQISVTLNSFVTSGTVVTVKAGDLSSATASSAASLLSTLDTSISNVNTSRATMGASINRLQYTVDNLTNISTNASASRSRIEDVDYGQATTQLARSQIIQQAATAMLAQANQQPQAVLSLLK